MAAISASHPHSTTTSLTPPASSQEVNPWDHRDDAHPADDVLAVHQESIRDIPHATQREHRGPDHVAHTNGDIRTRKMINGNTNPPKGVKRSAPHSYDSDGEHIRVNGDVDADAFEDPRSSTRTGPERRRAPTSASTPGNSGIGMDDDERSKWIHRDKLARIESEELQAAGFVIPRQRVHSRVRKGDTRHHHDQGGSTAKPADGPAPADQPAPRSRMNSNATADPKFQTDVEAAAWDLRLPEEIAANPDLGFASPSGLGKGATRIPVAKLSPAPIPIDHLERDSLMARKAASDGQGREAETIAYPKPRARSTSMKLLETTTTPALAPAKRSVTDTSTSPKKTATGAGARKPTGRGPSGTRPKTRGSGSNKDSMSSNGTRPSTRSGELKQPEGEPPWMLSAYRPDPRLPPDQQLLPTVARRLQQEKWEKEGKFGNVYDKEFRPLTDDGFPTPPEKKDVERPRSGELEEEQAPADVWPLKPEAPRSQTPKLSLSSYSTMPKIQDKPPTPLPSPRSPGIQNQQLQRLSVHDAPKTPLAREEEKQDKEGCGCCIVM